ncbi:MAG: galactokinase [Candidatus Aminicenantes bacterium]|nr:galactokinase [Candidatus Aminicenantes bacterium]
MNAKDLPGKFIQVFGSKPDIVATAPGRINIIGEHTDYNLGYVLPAAVNFRVGFAVKKKSGRKITLHSLNFNSVDTFDINHLDNDPGPGWGRYPRGILWALREEGFSLHGLNGLIWGGVPQGAGLSSSAAIEAGVLSGLNKLWKLGLTPEKMALLAQKAENFFIGVRCGIMDQFISFLAKPGFAIFLDCLSLEYEHVPFSPEKSGLKAVVYDSGVQRELASSEYNKRSKESAEALEVLKKMYGIKTYREATLDQIRKCAKKMDNTLFRRARHVISENLRVKEAVEALKSQNMIYLGELLLKSHESLRDDYQVSCPELDLLYETSREYPACIGGRMTGAGFGGSGIALVKSEAIEDFKRIIKKKSIKRNFIPPRIYAVDIDGGASAFPAEKWSDEGEKW